MNQLTKAINNNDLKAVESYISQINPLEIIFYLCLAIEKDHLEIVKLLLKIENLNINEKNQHGETALHIASLNNHVEIIKELLKNQAA